MAKKKKRSGAKKIVISVGRKRNPAKKRSSLLARARRGASKAGSRVKTIVVGAVKRRRNPSKRRRHNPGKVSALRSIALRPRRKHNPRRRRHSVKRRRHNPGFDVKAALISSAFLIGGTFLAQMAVPWIEKKLIELAPDSLGKADPTDGTRSTLGYIELAGAAGTVILGDYLQKKFGSSKVDFAPAAYAIATYMTIRGLRNAGLFPKESMTVLAGTGGMGATLDFGPALAYGSRTSNPSLPEGYSMLGSILSNEQLPAPAVGPHNVMQGYGGYTPSLV